jgi:hypothetical protein
VNPPAPDFYRLLDRLRAEGPDRWALKYEPTANEVDLWRVIFINKEQQRPVVIYGDDEVAIATRGRQ